MSNRSLLIGLSLIASLCLGACEDKKPPPKPNPAPETVASLAPSAQPPAPKTMPEVTLDNKRVQLAMDELMLNVPNYQEMLKTTLAKYPVAQPDAVVLNVARTNRINDVSWLVYQLFDAGAKAIEVRTTPRANFPGKLKLTSDKAIASKTQPCTFAGMVLKDLAVSYWRIKGGGGKRYSKGMAGPDLTNMHESFKKEVDSCNSTVFLFSADDTVDWGHAFDLATSMSAQDPPYKLNTFVLLREIPAAGHPVKLPP